MLRDVIIKWGSCFIPAVFILFFSPFQAYSQEEADSLLPHASLPNVIQYALKRHPQVQQSLIDEKITRLQIKSKLAEWYPQVNFNYFFQHNFQVQTSIIGGNAVRLGVNNSSALQFQGTQTIFDRDVVFARRTKGDIIVQSQQQTANNKIDVIVNVSKAFYDVLATEQQIKVSNENIVRLERSLKDSRDRYDAGIVDKTDYKRATIALNNAKASKKINEEFLIAKMARLKAFMNYPLSLSLDLIYDSIELSRDIILDTLQPIDYNRRIEYQILQTRRKLLEANVQYNKWSYLPVLSANGAYNLNFLNNEFGKLYNQSYPNSYAGLTLAFPIFQGGKRKHETREAEWELKRTDYDLVDLKNSINSEYNQALGGYKAALASFLLLRENVALAQEVYDVIELQYRSGIKTYLEVITAETDLRTAQINFFNALYLVMSNKIDVQRSLGEINP